MRALVILVALAILALTGCAHGVEARSTHDLLRDYAMFSGQGATIWSVPGELLDTPYPKAVKGELERRGYKCNPTGCFQP